MTADDSPPGYRSVVHRGPLAPLLIYYAPYRAVLFNMLLFMFISLMLTGRWFVIAVVVHVSLAVLWWFDAYLLESIWEARKFRVMLGAD
jgi:hypothetical protein